MRLTLFGGYSGAVERYRVVLKWYVEADNDLQALDTALNRKDIDDVEVQPVSGDGVLIELHIQRDEGGDMRAHLTSSPSLSMQSMASVLKAAAHQVENGLIDRVHLGPTL